VVILVAGLGGATGSGLAPIVAQLASECGSIPVCVTIMPFEFEKKLRFYAGLTLKRLRAASKGVIVIDNGEMLKTAGEATLKELYDRANEEVVGALGCLLAKPSDTAIPAGLNKFLGTVQRDGYSLLEIASSGSADKTEEALATAVIGINRLAEAKEASHAVVALLGDSSLPASDVGMAVKRLGSIMGNQSIDIEYSVSYGSRSQLLVGVLASGFKSTKYDEYDPLGSVLGTNVIDEGMDYSSFPGLEALPSCE